MLNAVWKPLQCDGNAVRCPSNRRIGGERISRLSRTRYSVITFGLLLVLLVWTLAQGYIKMWMFFKGCSLKHATKILVNVPILTFFSIIINWKQENDICKKITIRILSKFSTKKMYMRKAMGPSFNQKLVVL